MPTPKHTPKDLGAMLIVLGDELKLGATAHLIPLAGQVRSMTAGIMLDQSPYHKLTKGTDGQKGRFSEVKGTVPKNTEDRLLSDLDQINKLCRGIQLSEPDPQIIEKLELLATRLIGQELDQNQKPKSDDVQDITRLSSQGIASRFGVPHEALRKRLDRWRAKHPDQYGSGWIENTDRRVCEPKYIYKVKAIRPIIHDSPLDDSSEWASD